MRELKPRPFCGSANIRDGAFSISPDCFVLCEDCGASIETEVPWGDMTEKEHDQECWKELERRWNRRTDHDRIKTT